MTAGFEERRRSFIRCFRVGSVPWRGELRYHGRCRRAVLACRFLKRTRNDRREGAWHATSSYWVGTDPSGSRARAASARCALRGTRASSARWPSSASSSTRWMPHVRRCRVPMRCGGRRPSPPLRLSMPTAIPSRRVPARCRASTRSTGTISLLGKARMCSRARSRPPRNGARPDPAWLRDAIPTTSRLGRTCPPPLRRLPTSRVPSVSGTRRSRPQPRAPHPPRSMVPRLPQPTTTPRPTWTTTCRRCARSPTSPAWTRRARPPCSPTRTSSRCTTSRCRARRPTLLWSTSRASPSRSCCTTMRTTSRSTWWPPCSAPSRTRWRWPTRTRCSTWTSSRTTC